MSSQEERERVEALLRARAKRQMQTPLFSDEVRSELRSTLAADVRRAQFSLVTWAKWAGAAAAVLAMAFFLGLWSPAVDYGQLPLDVALLDEGGRPFSDLRGDEGELVMPEAFLVEIVSSAAGHVRVFGFDAEGRQHALVGADVELAAGGELLSRFTTATLLGTSEGLDPLWILILGSQDPLTEKALREWLPQQLEDAADTHGAQLQDITERLESELGCSASLTALRPIRR